MFSHYATRKISPICKISTFSEDLSFLNPRSHLNGRLVDSVATVVLDVIFDLQRQVCFERCINSLLQNSHVTPTTFFVTNTNVSIKVIYK